MSKGNAPKTNAMRTLDARRVAYEAFTYSDTIHSAEEVARVLGVPVGEVFKTLVVLAEPDRRLLIVTPGDRELNMRLVAKGVSAKSARMASQREAERLTGLLVGGISPLALLDRRFEVYLYAPAMALDMLYINGGRRGINLRLRVGDLIALTSARVFEATRTPTEDVSANDQ